MKRRRVEITTEEYARELERLEAGIWDGPPLAMPLCRDPNCPLFPWTEENEIGFEANPHEEHSFCQFCEGITPVESPDHASCKTFDLSESLGLASLTEWLHGYESWQPFLAEQGPSYWIPDAEMMAL